MIEHHCMVDGREVSGPLFDFALLMFHNARKLYELEVGPYFYLSKVSKSIEGIRPTPHECFPSDRRPL